MTQDQKLMEKILKLLKKKSLSLKSFQKSREIIWICLIKIKELKN